MGWGTWTTGNRTHVLAFTSPGSLLACLNEPGGSYRVLPFHRLAAEWPNYEWWLAVNPGLPIEAYLPSWFVAQLTRGEVRLPGRTMGARARIAQGDLAAALGGRARATGPMTPGAPIQTHVASAVVAGGVETVDAEIVDYPPVSATARVYTATMAAPAPSRTYDPSDQPVYGHDPYGPSGGYISRSPQSPAYTEVVQPAYPSEPSRYGTPVTNLAPPASSARTYTVFADEEPVYIDAEATTRIGVNPIISPSSPSPSQPTNRPPVRETEDAVIVQSGPPPADLAASGFVPANETETNLLAAAQENNNDAFLSTLLLARVMVPVPVGTPNGTRPRDPSFPWQIETADGQRFIAVFTSPERLDEHLFIRSISTISLRFVQLIGAWPDEDISFAINPGSPVGAILPGSEIIALASWATEVGLRDEPLADALVSARKHESTPVTGVAGAPANGADRATVMQRTVPHAQVPFYLERGYDRVSGFVNRASEVAHLTSPRPLYKTLGLVYPGSAFADDDAEVHVVRWVAHRSDMYRLPYGGQHEAGMRAMQGWVIERPPFRGNGFAPGETDVVSEFKVDSVRLPHGAQMWRLAKDGTETLVATFDADAARWVSGGPRA